MSVFERQSRLTVPAEMLAAWHLRPGTFQRLLPPWENVRILRVEGRLDAGTDEGPHGELPSEPHGASHGEQQGQAAGEPPAQSPSPPAGQTVSVPPGGTLNQPAGSTSIPPAGSPPAPAAERRQRVTLQLRLGGVWPVLWQAEARYRPAGPERSATDGEQFEDVQLAGPFAAWRHIHRFRPAGVEQSLLEDEVHYRLPGGWLGHLLFGPMVWRRLERLFAYRHAVTASDLRRHAAFRQRRPLRVAVSGSRGLIGSQLVPFLTAGGHRVVRLVRGAATPPWDDGTQWASWEPSGPPPREALAGCDAVIHLAGENIAAGRWNPEKKQRIRDSRVGPTRRLAAALAELPAGQRPHTLLCASAVGYYGDRGEEELGEDAAAGTGFFPDVCREWEAAAAPARDADIRTVWLRFGAVLSPQGGALGKQLFPFRCGLGGVLGPGTQWLSWVSLPDAVAAIHYCLMQESIEGPVNVVAPQAVTNRQWTKTLGRVLRRPAVLWLPAWLLRRLFGELADHALLVSTRAVPRRLLDHGFVFDHPELEPALRFLLGRTV